MRSSLLQASRERWVAATVDPTTNGFGGRQTAIVESASAASTTSHQPGRMSAAQTVTPGSADEPRAWISKGCERPRNRPGR